MNEGPIRRLRRNRRVLWVSLALAVAGRVALGLALGVLILMLVGLYVMAFATRVGS